MKPERKIIYGDWGYAVVYENVVWIPAVKGNLKEILAWLYKKTGIKRIIFSAVLNPEELKKHLKNIKREWDEWIEEVGDYSHCIEIEYEENGKKIKEIDRP